MELLVVVAVLALLGASLLPSVGHLRAKAAQARCANNLRVLGVAWNMYADDHEGWLLPSAFPMKKVAYLPDDYPTNAVQPGTWRSLLIGYLPPDLLRDGPNIFCCPADPKPTKSVTGSHVLFYSYGYLDYFGYPYESNPDWPTSGAYGLRRRKNIRTPGSTPVLVEMADHVHKASYISVMAGGYGSAIYSWMTFRHWGMGNVLFDDGHVELVGTNHPVCHSKPAEFFR
jgi:prepilin-type processing-associated H-X9-DG protein